ncbi:MAG: hypothetical protein ACLFTA_01140 [Candidatus Nanohaloarchaea archaeon]
MPRRENDPDDLGRKATDARRSQQKMYNQLENLGQAFEDGRVSPDEFIDEIGNLEERFGVFIEQAGHDYDTVEEFARTLNEDVTSVSFHYHEDDANEGITRRKALTGLGLTAAGVGSVAAIGEYLGWGAAGEGYESAVGTVEDEKVVESYVEDVLIEGSRTGDLQDIDDDWSTLANTYEEGVFDEDSDFEFESIKVILDKSPDSSEYEIESSVNGNSRVVEQRISDTAAEHFLDYAGTMEAVDYEGESQ